MQHRSDIDRIDGELISMQGQMGEMNNTLTRTNTMVEQLTLQLPNILAEIKDSKRDVAADKDTLTGTQVRWGITATFALMAVGLTGIGLAGSALVKSMNSDKNLAEVQRVGDKELALQRDDFQKQLTDADNVREFSDRDHEEKQERNFSDHKVAQAGKYAEMWGLVNENTTELDIIWAWYHPWLVEWGKIQAEMEQLKYNSRSSVGGRDTMIATTSSTKAKLREMEQHTNQQEHPHRQTYQIEGIQSTLDAALRQFKP